MTYRDEAASLEERNRMLRRALDESRARSSALTEEEAGLHRELAALHTKLEAARRTKRQLPLATVLVASPCDVPWTSMVGDDRLRHCAACKKDVHNLSAMTRDEIDAFLARAGATGPMPCISLFQRADGTVLTADCPVGIRRRRARSLLAATLGLGAAAVIAFTALALLQQSAVSGCSLRASVAEETPVPRTASELALPSKIFVTPQGYGYVAVDAPQGARVFEGEKFLGTAPLSFAADPGTHVLRVQHQGQSQIVPTVVREREIAHVSARFAPPVIRMGGAMMAPAIPRTRNAETL